MPETLRGHARDSWVRAVLAVCNSARDTSTVREWVRTLGMSERRFRDVCAVLKVSPKASLDLARMLRLVLQDKIGTPDDELAAEDIRTINRLIEQAGLSKDLPGLDFHRYLRTQTFVASTECINELSTTLEQQRAATSA